MRQCQPVVPDWLRTNFVFELAHSISDTMRFEGSREQGCLGAGYCDYWTW